MCIWKWMVPTSPPLEPVIYSYILHTLIYVQWHPDNSSVCVHVCERRTELVCVFTQGCTGLVCPAVYLICKDVVCYGSTLPAKVFYRSHNLKWQQQQPHQDRLQERCLSLFLSHSLSLSVMHNALNSSSLLIVYITLNRTRGIRKYKCASFLSCLNTVYTGVFHCIPRSFPSLSAAHGNERRAASDSLNKHAGRIAEERKGGGVIMYEEVHVSEWCLAKRQEPEMVPRHLWKWRDRRWDPDHALSYLWRFDGSPAASLCIPAAPRNMLLSLQPTALGQGLVLNMLCGSKAAGPETGRLGDWDSEGVLGGVLAGWGCVVFELNVFY